MFKTPKQIEEELALDKVGRQQALNLDIQNMFQRFLKSEYDEKTRTSKFTLPPWIFVIPCQQEDILAWFEANKSEIEEHWSVKMKPCRFGDKKVRFVFKAKE